jgi:archaemetzincin
MELANRRPFRLGPFLPLTMFGAVTLFAILYLHLLYVRCEAARNDDETLPSDFARLVPLHARLGKPRPGDWLNKHHELGQTYWQYSHSHPVRADERRIIYVQPLGEMNPTQKKIVDLAAEFLGVYYQLPVKVRENVPLTAVPKNARRKKNNSPDEQILTTYLREKVLQPRLPKDAVALIAFTTNDLWPGEGWNYVFGEASLSERVGIWSIHRYGDSDADSDAFRLCLLRTLKTATHETGHMFSMSHCTLYECNMCGSNHMGEADRHPLELCPHCLAKLCYATGAEPAKRFEQLIKFYKANDLKAEREFCERSLKAWNSPGKRN